MSTIPAFLGSKGFTSANALPAILSYFPTPGHEKPPKVGDSTDVTTNLVNRACTTPGTTSGIATPTSNRIRFICPPTDRGISHRRCVPGPPNLATRWAPRCAPTVFEDPYCRRRARVNRVASGVSLGLEKRVERSDHLRAFADRAADALHRSQPDVPDREDAAHARREGRVAPAGDHEPVRVERDAAAGEPARRRIGAEEEEDVGNRRGGLRVVST